MPSKMVTGLRVTQQIKCGHVLMYASFGRAVSTQLLALSTLQSTR
jgi:hypothetical protein